MHEAGVNEQNSTRLKAIAILDRLEQVYLAVIRGVALIVATLLVALALWLVASGVYNASRDETSVVVQPATVKPEEVIDVDLGNVVAQQNAKEADPLAEQRRFYKGFVDRYYELYQTRFERYKKERDRALTREAFDQRYLNSNERLTLISDGLLSSGVDRADLDALVAAMTDAATNPVTVRRLSVYRDATPIRTTRTIRGMRPERYCDYYGYYIDECISYATRQVPYSRRVQEERLPAGVVSHADLFGAYQGQFLTLLNDRRSANEVTARNTREEIIADNLEGKSRMWSAAQALGAFIVLMFLFLLIALERHQRKIAQATPAPEPNLPS